MILAAALMLAVQSAASCSALQVRVTPAVRRADAARISSLSGQRVLPADVSYILNDGPWRLVFATPREAERGVFVLRAGGRGGYRLVDTWGGVMEPGENGAASWARGLPGGGVPARLARCMNSAIQAGR